MFHDALVSFAERRDIIMERIKKYEPLWGKWKVKRRIGAGNFGAVYEIQSEVLGELSSCAVKIISFENEEMLRGVSKDETLSEEKIEQLRVEEARKNVREAVLMNRLQGRNNIVTIYDYDIFSGESTTDVVIRMELLTNLNDYIKLQNFESDTDLKKMVIKLGTDICKALEDCEAENIVHRDIKPENIFINKNETFKLGDFGLSRKMTKSASLSLKKSAGTPLYMAPEALGWGSKIEHQSDIYSLGIVMYQMLNDGNIPFVEDMQDFFEVDEAIGRRADGEIPLPPKYDEEELWKIIKKAIQFKKEDRYQSAAEMRKELEALENPEKNSIKAIQFKKEEWYQNVAEKKKEQDVLKNPEKSSIQSEKKYSRLGEKKVELVKVENVEKKEESHRYEVGDTITFGSYPQKGGSGTLEPLEWIILKKEDGKAFLVSRKVIDCKPFHKNRIEMTWEASDMRRWLNEVFYRKAFGGEERQQIQKTLLRQSENPKYRGKSGNDTEDYVFLLDIQEIEALFWGQGEQICQPTEYAIRQGVFGSVDSGTAWWTRSLGKNPYSIVFIKNDGDIEYGGTFAICDFIGVRPAIWISVDE